MCKSACILTKCVIIVTYTLVEHRHCQNTWNGSFYVHICTVHYILLHQYLQMLYLESSAVKIVKEWENVIIIIIRYILYTVKLYYVILFSGHLNDFLSKKNKQCIMKDINNVWLCLSLQTCTIIPSFVIVP